jgi:hypothetical protein
LKKLNTIKKEALKTPLQAISIPLKMNKDHNRVLLHLSPYPKCSYLAENSVVPGRPKDQIENTKSN